MIKHKPINLLTVSFFILITAMLAIYIKTPASINESFEKEPTTPALGDDLVLHSFSIDEFSTNSISGRFKITNIDYYIYTDLHARLELSYSPSSDSSKLINFKSIPIYLSRFETQQIHFNHTLPKNIPQGDYSLNLKIIDKAHNLYSTEVKKLPLNKIGSNNKDFPIIDNLTKKENNIYTLDISHSLQKPKSFYADIEIYKKSELSSNNPTLKKTLEEDILLNPAQKQTVTINLPEITEPGVYKAFISLKDSNKLPISNKLSTKLIIPGDYATLSRVHTHHLKQEEAVLIATEYVGKSNFTGYYEDAMIFDANLETKIKDFEKNTIYTTQYPLDLYPKPSIHYLNIPLDYLSPSFTIHQTLSTDTKILDEYSTKHFIYLITEEPDPSKTQNINIKRALSDIADTPYKSSVELLTTLGVVNGYEDGSFRPERTITRAEFMTMAYNLIFPNRDLKPNDVKNKFSDVPKNHWAYTFINDGASLNILKGYPDGRFMPDNEISYPEALTVCVNLLKEQEKLDKMTNWPTDYINTAIDFNLTDHIPHNSITSEANANRGDVATMLAKVYQLR